MGLDLPILEVFVPADRAIDIVNLALDQFGSPVYVRHEVVHNKYGG